MRGRSGSADFSRNIGLLTPNQQAALQAARVAVCGVGGMGGVAAEALARLGVGTLVLADGDRYEPTDVNRQIHCDQRVIGRLKVEVISSRLRAINPELHVAAFGGVGTESVATIVAAADLILNGMDCVRSSLLLEREARRQRRRVVNAWITPYATVFVTTPDGPGFEECLGLPTAGREPGSMTDAEVEECLRREVTFTFSQFDPYAIVDRELVDDVLAGRMPRPSLVPVVWLSGTLMANEAMKILTTQGRIASHWGVFYDQYEHRLGYRVSGGNPA